MFNMDMMKAGADAFGKIADSIERISSVALAFALREKLACPYSECAMIAGHAGDHDSADGTVEEAHI